MCSSLRLITNQSWRHIFLGQAVLHAKAQINATAYYFADIISPRRWHILLGPFRCVMQICIVVSNY